MMLNPLPAIDIICGLIIAWWFTMLASFISNEIVP
jgi:hypothetical protein